MSWEGETWLVSLAPRTAQNLGQLLPSDRSVLRCVQCLHSSVLPGLVRPQMGARLQVPCWHLSV